MAIRKGSAQWRGDLKGGEGDFTPGDGELSAPFSFESRFEEGSVSNPEELIGAAQAAAKAMELAEMLGEAGTTADAIRATGQVELRQVKDEPTSTKIEIEA